MKVRATRLTNAMGDEVSESSWLTVGREYVVLAIYTNLAATRPKVSIVVITDEGGHDFAFFDLENFEITDPQPSGLWRVSFDGRNLSIEPEPWADLPSFWEVLNGDIPVVQVLGDHAPQMNATRRFDSAVRELHEEAGMPLPDDWVADTDRLRGPASSWRQNSNQKRLSSPAARATRRVVDSQATQSA